MSGGDREKKVKSRGLSNVSYKGMWGKGKQCTNFDSLGHLVK